MRLVIILFSLSLMNCLLWVLQRTIIGNWIMTMHYKKWHHVDRNSVFSVACPMWHECIWYMYCVSHLLCVALVSLQIAARYWGNKVQGVRSFWSEGWLDWWMCGWMVYWMMGPFVNGWTVGPMAGWLDRWREKWLEGWTNGGMVGWTWHIERNWEFCILQIEEHCIGRCQGDRFIGRETSKGFNLCPWKRKMKQKKKQSFKMMSTLRGSNMNYSEG